MRTVSTISQPLLWHCISCYNFKKLHDDAALGHICPVMSTHPSIFAGTKYGSSNVLADPNLREGIKKFTSWPTIPQVIEGSSHAMFHCFSSPLFPWPLGDETETLMLFTSCRTCSIGRSATKLVGYGLALFCQCAYVVHVDEHIYAVSVHVLPAAAALILQPVDQCPIKPTNRSTAGACAVR